MAKETTANTSPKEVKETKAETVSKPVHESKYTIAELTEAAKSRFKTNKVIVRAALKNAGKEAYTLTEAAKLINEFKNKEVKA